MPEVYRTTFFSKIVYCILPLFLAFVFSFAFQEHASPLLGITAGLLLSGVIWYCQSKRQIRLDNDGITYTTIFREKTMMYLNVQGFRVNTGKNSFLKFMGKDGSKLLINAFSDFKDKSDITAAISEHCVNLDAAEREAQMKVLLADESMGSNQEERAEAIKSNTRISRYFNMAAIFIPVAVIWTHIEWITALAFLWPLLGLGLLIKGQGKLKFISMKKNSPMPNLILGFAFPAGTLFFTTFFSLNLIHEAGAWLPSIFIGLILTTLLYKFGINKLEGNIAGQVSVMLVVSILYSSGAYLFLNKALDTAPCQTYPASILDRGVTTGKSTSYWVTLTDFGPYKGAHRLVVSHSVYGVSQIGDTVKVDLHPGKFNLAWYEMETPVMNPPVVQ